MLESNLSKLVQTNRGAATILDLFCSVLSICLPGVTTIQGNLRRKPNCFNLFHQLEMWQRGGHGLDASLAEMEAAHVSYHDVTL